MAGRLENYCENSCYRNASGAKLKLGWKCVLESDRVPSLHRYGHPLEEVLCLQ